MFSQVANVHLIDVESQGFWFSFTSCHWTAVNLVNYTINLENSPKKICMLIG